MSFGRFEFTDNVMYVKGVGPRRAAALEKLNIFTKYDLLTHYPRAYENYSNLTKIRDVFEGENVLLIGKIFNITSRESRGLTIINAMLRDETGYIKLTWFNQKYLLTKLKDGMRLLVIGKAKYDSWSGGLAMSQIQSFTILEPDEEPELGIVPIYPSTASISQSVFRTAIKNLLAQMPTLNEILPQEILDAQNLISLDEAMRAIHFPENFAELDMARRRLAFDELFLIQCGLMLIKRQTQDERLGISHKKNGALVKAALAKLPFN